MHYEIKEKNCDKKLLYVEISENKEQEPYLIADLDYALSVFKWYEDNCDKIDEEMEKGTIPEMGTY